MIITINTKEDSREEIKKAIQMLMRLIEESSNSEFAPAATEGMFNIFGDSSPATPEAKKEEEPTSDRIEIYDY